MPSKITLKIFILGVILFNSLFRVQVLMDQYFITRFTALTVLCGLACWLLWPKKGQKITVQWTLLDSAFLAYFLLHLLSIAWAFNAAEAIFTAQRALLAFGVYFLFRQLFEREGQASKDAMLLASGLLTVALIGISGYQLGELAAKQGWSEKNLYEVIGMAGHKNLLSSLLFLLLPFNLLSTLGSPKRKPLWIGLVSIQLLLIIVLQTRAVYLALGGAVLVLAGYLIVENTQQHLKTFKRLGALGLVLLLMVSSLVYFGGSKSNYLQQLNPLTYKASSSGVERLFVWHKTRELIKDNWLLGYGGGNWKIFFPSKSVEGGYRLQEKNIVFTRVHNDFLEVMAETGIMGLLSFIGLFALPILAIFNAYGSAQEWKKRELMILLAALVGYCIISFFDFPKERIEHQSLISILIAYTAFLCRQHFPINLLSIDISAYFRPLLIGLGALFLLNLPTSYYRIVGEYYAVKAINAKIKKNWVELSQVAPLSHSALFNMDAMTLPMKWYEGLGLYQQGQQDEAMVPFEEAFAYNPHNFHVINNFATCLVHKNRFEEAIALFHQALAINPKFDDSIFNLSYCYYSLAQYEEALKWVNKTRSNPGRKAEFLRAIESRLPKNSELQ